MAELYEIDQKIKVIKRCKAPYIEAMIFWLGLDYVSLHLPIAN
jgi:hypothetical protein